VRQDKPARDAAMRRACLKYGYTMAAVALEAGVRNSNAKTQRTQKERQTGSFATFLLLCVFASGFSWFRLSRLRLYRTDGSKFRFPRRRRT
jgi:hypothetical protein